MKVAITGASGLIGSALTRHLRARGDQVLTLVRRAAKAPHEVAWDPASGEVDIAGLAGIDALVHLAGAPVGARRWTPSYKSVIVRSRVDGTSTIARALARLEPAPQVFVSGSAMGFYGDRGDELLDESARRGIGFFPDVVTAWEGAADPARAAGIRVVHPRTALVMARRGGAFGRLLPLVRLGLAGPLGSGRQWWSWITLTDQVRALAFAIDRPLQGPVNLASPQPLRQRELVAVLARAAHRPALLPAPAIALRIALGQFAEDMVASDRLVPKALTDAGFGFEHPDIDSAAAWVLGPGPH